MDARCHGSVDEDLRFDRGELARTLAPAGGIRVASEREKHVAVAMLGDREARVELARSRIVESTGEQLEALRAAALDHREHEQAIEQAHRLGLANVIAERLRVVVTEVVRGRLLASRHQLGHLHDVTSLVVREARHCGDEIGALGIAADERQRGLRGLALAVQVIGVDRIEIRDGNRDPARIARHERQRITKRLDHLPTIAGNHEKMQIMGYLVCLLSLVVACGKVVPLEDHCTNGTLDGDETGVDCGGSCDACVGMCGNTIVEGSEACDSGGVQTATCEANCGHPTCGDTIVNHLAGEDCDGTSGCDTSCHFPFHSTGADGAFAPTTDTVLPAGIYNYTTITIPAGVKVTTDGTGVLELRATGDVTILGTINVSGGKGGNGQASSVGCYEGGGGGGATGNAVGVAPTGDCPIASVGGMGTAGSNAPPYFNSNNCAMFFGGSFGGGGGGGTCSGGGGGGGFAGGGGGAGFNNGTQMGPGAAGGGANAGAGGTPGTVNTGAGNVPGSGGHASGAYAGANGTLVVGCTTANPASGGGGGSIGMAAAADLAITTTFQPGSGGGGGAGQCSSCGAGGGGGGGGGGAVRIASATSLTIGASGIVLANGGDGGNAVIVGSNGGGGGSGGVVQLASPKVEVIAGGVVQAKGGAGGQSLNSSCGGGGAGGLGRIRISAAAATCTLAGTFNPPLAAGCSISVTPEKVSIAEFPN